MPFEKNNPYRLNKRLKQPLGKVIGFRGYEGQKEKLQAIPDWQEQLREFVDKLIKENLGSDGQ